MRLPLFALSLAVLDGADLPCWQCIDRENITITAVVHGTKSDGFWRQLQRAALAAGENLHINLNYELFDRFDSVKMANRILEEAAKKPDALLVTVASSRVVDAIKTAAAQVPVFSLNSGYDVALSLGVKAHFSMHEYNGGLFAGPQYAEKFQARSTPMKLCLSIDHEAGNVGLAHRQDGFFKYCDDNGIPTESIAVNGANVDAMRNQLAKAFGDMAAANKLDGAAILCLGQASVITVVTELKQALGGTLGTNLVGTFDVSADVYSVLSSGDVIFGVDQNQWLQGYLPVLLATLYATTGQLMAPEVYMTGPAFLTEPPSAEYSTCVGEAFPVCRCPWASGDESKITSEMCTEVIGTSPVAKPECPCQDIRNIKIRGVVHGTTNDGFWHVVRAGALQAAADYRLSDFKMELYEQFSTATMAEDILRYGNDSSVDGIFVTLPGSKTDAVSAAFREAAKSKWSVSINSGGGFAKDLDPGMGKFLAHISQDEFVGGQRAARMLIEKGVTHLICIVHEYGNQGLMDRCLGAEDYAANLGVKITISEMGLFIDTSKDDQIVDYVKNQLDSDLTIDGLLLTAQSTVPASMRAMSESRYVSAGSFDTSSAIFDGIESGRILFGVDQLPYMQGYMAVVTLVVKVLTGLSLALPANKVLASGPFMVTTVDATQAMCLKQEWTEELVGAAFFKPFTKGFPVCEFKPPIDCQAGQYLNFENSCTDCAPGKYQPLSVHRERECLPCNSGFYSPLTGMADCWKCPASSSSKSQASACTLSLPCDPCIDREKIRIRAVVHGKKSDLFWLRVKRAMLTAGKMMHVDLRVDLQVRESQEAMAQNIKDVVDADRPNVLLVSIPGPGVFDAIKEAAQSVWVFSLNSGADDFLGLGSIAHFSMNEWLGGYQAAGKFQELFQADGSELALCYFLNYELSNGALVSRGLGFKQGCEELGLEWVGFEIKPDNVEAHSEWAWNAIDTFQSSSAAANGGLGMLLAGETPVFGVARAYREKGKPSDVKIGSFDFGKDVVTALAAGEIVFGINQNEWLQGFLPVVIATLYVTTGNLMSPKIYPTGPDFVTQAPSKEAQDRGSEAFPVCECPWAAGLEDVVNCVAPVGEDYTIGACPLETQCTLPCTDPRNFKIVGVTHAHEVDTFWFVVKAGAEQAANDLRLKGFDMDLFGPPDSGRSDAFSEELFAETIREVADRPDVDALFISIFSDSVHDAIREAAGKKLVVTINSGYDVSASLNPDGGKLLAHVGMHEFNAGKIAGQTLLDLGATHLLCIINELSASAMEDRCNGAGTSMLAAGERITVLNLPKEGVDMGSDDQIADMLASKLEADGSIDAALCGASMLVPGTLTALNRVGKQQGMFFAGSFDTSGPLMNAISAGDFFYFGVDQQQYMQGYMAVMYAWIHLLTGLRIANHVIETGPYLVRGPNPSKDKCQALSWNTENPEFGGPFVGETFMPSMDAIVTTGYPVCEIKPPKDCGPGTYLNIQNDCANCTQGKFKVGTNQDTECMPCPAGTFALYDASEYCSECKPGNFTNSTGNSLCLMCEPGYFTMEARKTACNKCAMGYYQDDIGQASCKRCEGGTYVGFTAASECIKCSGIRTTQFLASTSEADCLCERDFFSETPQSPCQKCPQGLTCAIGSDLSNFFNKSVTVGLGADIPMNYPLLEPRHYAEPSEPTSVYRCLSEVACPGGEPGTCGPHMEGIACGMCEDKYFRAEDSSCKKCNDVEKSTVLFPIIPIVCGPLCVVLLYWKGRDDVELWGSPPNMMQSILFLGLVYVQILAAISTCYIMKPTLLKEGSDWTSYSYELMSLLRPDCGLFSDFKSSFVGKLFLPIYAAITFMATFLASKVIVLLGVLPAVYAMDGDVVFNGYMGVFNTFFMGIAQQTFSLFQCYEHVNGKRSLRSQANILCESKVWNELVAAAVLAILVFCVGALALFTYIIAVAHRYFSETRFRKRWKFLFIRFRPNVQWWALLLLAKGIWLNLATVLFDKGTRQLVWLMTGVLGYLVLNLHCKPWRSSMCEALDAAMHMVVILLFAFLPYFAFPEESFEQVDHYARSYFAISIIPFFIIPVMLTVLLMWRFRPPSSTRYSKLAADMHEDFRLLSNPAKMTKTFEILNDHDYRLLKAAHAVISSEFLALYSTNSVTRLIAHRRTSKNQSDISGEDSNKVDETLPLSKPASGDNPVVDQLPASASVSKAACEMPEGVPRRDIFIDMDMDMQGALEQHFSTPRLDAVNLISTPRSPRAMKTPRLDGSQTPPVRSVTPRSLHTPRGL